MSLDLKTDTVGDFLGLGKDSMYPEFGLRHVKYSHVNKDEGMNEGEMYIGEWSNVTNLPHGRGILFTF